MFFHSLYQFVIHFRMNTHKSLAYWHRFVHIRHCYSDTHLYLRKENVKCILIYFHFSIPNIHIVGGFSCGKGKIPILIYFLSLGEGVCVHCRSWYVGFSYGFFGIRPAGLLVRAREWMIDLGKTRNTILKTIKLEDRMIKSDTSIPIALRFLISKHSHFHICV